MFIRFFRHSYFAQYMLLLVFAIVLWISSFIHPPYIGAQSIDSPLYNLLISLSNSKLSWTILAFVLLLLQSLIFNFILSSNDIIRKTSLLGAATYFLMMSHLPAFQYLHPALLSHFFLLLTLYFLLNMYGKEIMLRDSFRLGFYIGLASLFYFPTIIFIIFVYAALLLFQVNGWRQWFIPFFSFFTPYVFLFTYYFAFDKTYIFLNYFENFFTPFTFEILYLSLPEILIAIGLGLITLLSFFKAIARNKEKGMHIRKKVAVFISLMIISYLGLIVTNAPLNEFTTILIPTSVLLAMHFNDLRKIIFADIYMGLTIAIIIFNMYA